MQKSNSPRKCRTCNTYGYHKLDIFDDPSISEKIFECVRIRVETSDKSTKLCDNCCGIFENFFKFVKVCHATNEDMRDEPPTETDANSIRSHNESSVSEMCDTGPIKQEPVDISALAKNVRNAMKSSNIQSEQPSDVKCDPCINVSDSSIKDETDSVFEITDESIDGTEVHTEEPLELQRDATSSSIQSDCISSDYGSEEFSADQPHVECSSSDQPNELPLIKSETGAQVEAQDESKIEVKIEAHVEAHVKPQVESLVEAEVDALNEDTPQNGAKTKKRKRRERIPKEHTAKKKRIETKIKCPFRTSCNYLCDTQAEMDHHSSTYHKNDCDVCEKPFESDKKLQEHKKVAHEPIKPIHGKKKRTRKTRS